MKESVLESRCRSYAVDHGCLFIKNSGTRGFPDRTIIGPNGSTIFVEFKRPDGFGVVSALQHYYIAQIRSRNARAYVVDTFDAFKTIVQEHLV